MNFLLENTRFGFCWFDLIAVLILAAFLICFAVKRHDMKKEEKELEEELAEIYADRAEKQEQTV